MLTESELNDLLGRPKTFQPVQVQTRLPWTPRLKSGRVQVVYAHPLVADLFVDVCHEAASRSSWVPQRIDSYSPRAIRGYRLPTGWRLGDKGTSRHAWAVAWDIFATPADVPPPGGVWTPENPVPADFAAPFEQAGFVWGRRWNRRDDPHIELGKAPPSGPDFDPDFLSTLLKQGDYGPEVRRLQFMLRAVGQDVLPNGIFDSVTKGAVLAVQEAGRTTVDGIAGPKTEAAMMQMVVSEYGQRIGALVTAAYVDALGRNPDARGLDHYTKELSSGRLRVHSLWQVLWDSEEAARHRAAHDTGPLQQKIADLEARIGERDQVVADYRARMATIRSIAEEIVEATE